MLLAIDTTSSACSCALYSDGLVASAEHFGEKGHAEMLIPQIRTMLADAGCEVEAITKIAVTTGPGSFTGVRVGIAAARGLALSLNCELVGLTSFEALASAVLAHANSAGFPLNKGEQFSCVIDARRDQVYVESFVFNGAGTAPTPLAEGAAMDIETAKTQFKKQPSLLLGGGAKLVGTVNKFFDNDNFMHILAKNFCANVDLFVSKQDKPPVPLYLRAPDAKPAFSFLTGGA